MKLLTEKKVLFPSSIPSYKKEKNKINIGTAGGMTRLSTGYTFLKYSGT